MGGGEETSSPLFFINLRKNFSRARQGAYFQTYFLLLSITLGGVKMPLYQGIAHKCMSKSITINEYLS